MKCPICVKKSCVYSVYANRDLNARQMIDSIDNQCMNCFRCIQGCPKELIHKSINPEYRSMGDFHWTPEIITSLWYQAETGKIPVSGAGYPGPFSGSGFDSMWTDMSEIVRPTRDGIHGREYISTAVGLGSAPSHLSFDSEGELEVEIPSLVGIPLPIILKVPAFGAISEATLLGWAGAVRRLGTLLAVSEEIAHKTLNDHQGRLIPIIFNSGPKVLENLEDLRIVEIPWAEDWQVTVQNLRRSNPFLLVSVRLSMAKGMEDKALSLGKGGVSVIHLEAGPDGHFLDNPELHLKDGIHSVHLKLVEAKIREQVSLLVSGGLAMAEHVAKAIICGADAVFTDLPILIALECRMCKRCLKGLACPVEIDRASPEWVASRVVNLLGAWHNQLLEVMGAMGIRDVRRLRGEVGRAMFFEDLEKGAFESMADVGEAYELE
ncbi:MAG: glutamate synthase-related protein [Pseudomonadota bacterium]